MSREHVEAMKVGSAEDIAGDEPGTSGPEFKNTPSGSISDISGTVREEQVADVSRISEFEGTVGEAAVQVSEADIGSVWKIGDVIEETYEVRGGAAGAMGAVYFVHHRNWNTMLAVKSPHAGVFKSERGKARYIREAESWIELGLHPNVVSAHYVKSIDDIPRVFVEFVDGGTLTDWIRNGKTDDLKTVVDIAVQVSEGMEQACRKGLTHRDLKPDNVMMTQDGTAKITDFGLVKVGDETPNAQAEKPDSAKNVLRTMSGARLGTPAYMAPEQWTSPESVDERADIYSFGVILYEMLCGRLPFLPEGATGEERLASLQRQHCESAVPDLRQLKPDAPESFISFILKCLEKKPESRHLKFEGVSDRLREIYEAEVGEQYPREKPDEAELLAASLNNKALSYLELGRESGAEDLWQQALKLDSHHIEATYNAGLYEWRAAKITDEELVRRVEEARKSLARGWRGEYLLGLVHLERGDGEAAVAVLEAAVKSSDDEPDVVAALERARALGLSRVGTFEGPGGGARCLSADGCRVLLITEGLKPGLWDTGTGQCIRIFEGGHTMVVTSLALSADERWALSGSRDRTLRLWEVATGRCVRTFEGHTGSVESVALSADGSWALSGSVLGKGGSLGMPAVADDTLRLWEVASGRCIHTFKGHKESVTSVLLSADDRWALSAGEKTLRLWEVATGRCVRTFEGRARSPARLSADGRWALSASGDGRTLRLWEVASGRCIRTFELHTSDVHSVNLSADGRQAISVDVGKVWVWETSTGRCIRTFKRRGDQFGCVVLSADGQWALASSRRAFRIWKVAPVVSVAYEFCRFVTAQEASANEEQFRQIVQQGRVALAAQESSECLKWIREARRLRGRERDREVLDLNAELKLSAHVTRLAAGWQVRTLEEHKERVSAIALSADGRWALSASTPILAGESAAAPRLWDVASGRCVRAFSGHTGFVRSVALSADGRWALSASEDKTIRLWEVSTGHCACILEKRGESACCVALNTDRRWALSGSWDKTLRLWEVSTGRCVRTLEGHTDCVRSVALSADGRLALSGSEDTTHRLWEVSTGRCVRTLEGHTGKINSVCLSADGRLALSGSESGVLGLWDLSSGCCIRTIKATKDPVTSVVLSADARWVLSASGVDPRRLRRSGDTTKDHDNTVRVWEAATGSCVRTFEGHGDRVTSVVLSADNRWVLSGSDDKTLRLWELDWEYEFPDPADWDEGARPYLENFLTLHTPYAGTLAPEGQPSEEEVTRALTREGRPSWTGEEFEQLLYTLGCAGYGWLRPEGVKKELEEMAANWGGPPPLPGS